MSDILDLIKNTENISETSWIDSFYLPKILIPDEKIFKTIWDLHPIEHAEVMILGNLIPIPRWQCSYGKDYYFSGNVSKASEIPKEIKPYIDWVNSLGYGEFNGILMNFYQDGSHYIGCHSDDTRQLVKNSPIVTITLALSGINRKFRIRNKLTKNIVKDITTPNGYVLVMGGKFQTEFKHEIVKITGNNAKQAGSRISITLRQFR